MAHQASPKMQAEPAGDVVVRRSINELLDGLDILEADPLLLHVVGGAISEIRSLCVQAEQTLAELRRLEREQTKSWSFHRRQAVGSVLAYAGYALSEARRTLAAQGNSAVAAAQLADGVRAVRNAWTVLQSDQCLAMLDSPEQDLARPRQIHAKSHEVD
jgi:hypothetical protein